MERFLESFYWTTNHVLIYFKIIQRIKIHEFMSGFTVIAIAQFEHEISQQFGKEEVLCTLRADLHVRYACLQIKSELSANRADTIMS
jgi:hypothetical protein